MLDGQRKFNRMGEALSGHEVGVLTCNRPVERFGRAGGPCRRDADQQGKDNRQGQRFHGADSAQFSGVCKGLARTPGPCLPLRPTPAGV